MKHSPLKNWMTAANADEQEQLAKLAGTSRQYLRLLSADGKSYQRHAEPGLAAAIEEASIAMHKSTRGRLPRLYRTDLAQTCAGCPYARQCLGATARRAGRKTTGGD
jgi:hypothetical protein